ncbi:hypothetical protein RZE82_05370 [Mollicutes bacterium LVI A0039]|nr:hypothetical protein RZE82_05370 [Mollicutes bacterium LVI A0039]
MLDKFLNVRFITSLLIMRFIISYLILPRFIANGELSANPITFTLNLISTGLLLAALILALIWLGKYKGKD